MFKFAQRAYLARTTRFDSRGNEVSDQIRADTARDGLASDLDSQIEKANRASLARTRDVFGRADPAPKADDFEARADRARDAFEAKLDGAFRTDSTAVVIRADERCSICNRTFDQDCNPKGRAHENAGGYLILPGARS